MHKLESIRVALSLLFDLKGLTQAEVCDRAGIARSQLSRYMQGSMVPGIGQLLRILEACDCNMLTFGAIVHCVEQVERWILRDPEELVSEVSSNTEIDREMLRLKAQLLEIQQRLPDAGEQSAEHETSTAR